MTVIELLQRADEVLRVIEQVQADKDRDSDDESDDESGDSGGLTDDERAEYTRTIERLNTFLGEAEGALRRLNAATDPVNAWVAGPSFDDDAAGAADDEMHTNALWGLHIDTDRDVFLGTAAIEALTSGTLTMRLYEFDGTSSDHGLGAVVAAREVRVRGYQETIALDLHVPPGEYLLTRPVPRQRDDDEGTIDADLPDNAFAPSDDAVSLRRRENYDGWEGDSRDGVQFLGGAHPVYSNNEFWYYFHDLDVQTGDAAGPRDR